jgi:aryl-alcohol dehydrogenase-like predicted oxidoreductase
MIAQHPFGRTGHQSSRVIFGGAALGRMRQERADRILPLLLEHGVNHLDTAASYGESELRLAPWLVDHRADFFLATKTGERTGAAARAELELSLTRLGVDSVDLIQLHNLVEPDEWDVAHGPGGVVEAMAAARDEGLVRFIGVTGHGLRIAGMHLRSLERFPFDSVLLPYNFVLRQNAVYRSDVEDLLTVCAEHEVAVQTIKSIARRRWDDGSDQHYSWYEPLSDPDAIGRAVDYVLDRAPLFLNTTSDANLLPLVLAAADRERRSPDEAALQDDIEQFDVRPLFDGADLERI